MFFDEVFCDEVVASWRAVNHRSADLEHRLRVFASRGSIPINKMGRSDSLLLSAWRNYVELAHQCGLFELANGGADRRTRLTGRDDAGFRSGMAECFAAWYCVEQLRFQVNPLPPLVTEKRPEFEAVTTKNVRIRVEVKSPAAEEQPDGEVFEVTYHKNIRSCLEEAYPKFREEHVNLLVIAGHRNMPLITSETQIQWALYGYDGIELPGGKPTFRRDGAFLRWDGKRETYRFKRVSAVLVLEQFFSKEFIFGDGTGGRIDLAALLLHHPFATNPLPVDTFNSIPQYVPEGDRMKWLNR